MLHRELEIHERFLLHPRILDVLEALIGPDVLALQSMLFLKPGGAGQGFHLRLPTTSRRIPTRSVAPGSLSTEQTRRTGVCG